MFTVQELQVEKKRLRIFKELTKRSVRGVVRTRDFKIVEQRPHMRINIIAISHSTTELRELQLYGM